MNKINTKQKIMSLLLTGVVTSTFINMEMSLTKEKPVTVSKDLADSFSKTNNLFTICDSDEYLQKIVLKNEGITATTLENATEISIHANNFNFDELDLMPNLKTITIEKANALTEEEKLKLSSSNVDTIILKYDYKDMTVNTSLQISMLSNKNVYLQCPEKKDREEIESLVFYNIYNNLTPYEKSFIKVLNYSQEEMNKLASWNNKLNNIINSMGFTSKTKDIDKLITIINYVTNTYTYDPEIGQYLDNDINLMGIKNKADVYYENMLSNILDDNNEYATCANYAGLTNILSQYVGLDVDLQIGKYDETGHAWNTYHYRGQDVIIDSTALDDYQTYNYYKDIYQNTNIDEYTKDLLIESIFITREYEPNMITRYNVSKTYYDDKEIEKDIMYVNSETNEITKRKIALQGLVSSVAALALIAGIAIDKKKSYKKDDNLVIENSVDIYNELYEQMNFHR